MDISFFTYLWVAIVITVIVLAVTAVIDDIIDREKPYIVGWTVSSIGFGTCLTFILYQIGVL